jgi:MFS family permease
MNDTGRIERVYVLVTALSWFAAVLPMAVTVLFAQSRGFSLIDVGLFTGVYALTVALLEVPTGGLADTIGRKRVALLSYGLSIVAMGTFLFAFSLPALFAFACLFGTSRALGSGTLQAWFVDALHEVDRDIELQPPLARAGTWQLVGLALGTLLGGFLPTVFAGLPADPAHVLTPLATPLVASMIMQMVVIVVVMATIHEPHVPPASGEHRAPSGVGRVIGDALELARRNPVIGWLLAVELLSGVALTGIETFWQPFFADRLAPGRTWVLGVLLAGGFAMGMLGNLAAIPLSRWLGRRYALVAALFKLAQASALVLLAIQQNVLVAAGFFWTFYVMLAGSGSPLGALFHAEVPAHRRSVMLSVQSLAGFTGAFIGSIGLGWIAQRSGVGVAWIVAGVVLLIAVGTLVRVDATRAPAAETPPEPAEGGVSLALDEAGPHQA